MAWLDIADMRQKTLPAALRHQADRIGDHTYLMFGDQSLSYAEVFALSNSYAHGLRELGVRAGDTVCFFGRNCQEIVLLAFAANKLGACWVPINSELRGDWLSDPIARCEADVMFVDAAMVPRLSEVWHRLSVRTVLTNAPVEEDRLPGAEIIDIAELSRYLDAPDLPDVPTFRDIASVMWTSGTTGKSKGVMQSHHAWIYQTDYFQRRRQAIAGDVFYNCLPMYNSGAWILSIYAALVCGGAAGIDDGFSVRGFWDRVNHYQATQAATLGSMHMFLWQQPESPTDADNSLRDIYALPLPGEIIEPFKKRFGIEFVLQLYGQSEVMGLSFTAEDGKGTPGSAGFVREDMDVRLVDDDDIEVPRGEVGEICVRPQVPHTLFGGYYRDEAATLAAFRDLWYHTGDLGRMNEDGELFWVDRKQDYLRFKGRNLSSFEVELVAGRHPDVKEVAAVGMPRPGFEAEEELLLAVVAQQGKAVAATELARFINNNAPHYFVPRYISLVEDLPHTPTGRVQKYAIRKTVDLATVWDCEAENFIVER